MNFVLSQDNYFHLLCLAIVLSINKSISGGFYSTFYLFLPSELPLRHDNPFSTGYEPAFATEYWQECYSKSADQSHYAKSKKFLVDRKVYSCAIPSNKGP